VMRLFMRCDCEVADAFSKPRDRQTDRQRE
jgi:hypothetical protein